PPPFGEGPERNASGQHGEPERLLSIRPRFCLARPDRVDSRAADREPSPMKYSLRVNGKTTSVDVPPAMPLLWALRDALDLPGTKYGCGVAQCGACTEHMNGEPVRSCQVPVSAVGAAAITTIEGLSADGSHPVQRAWRELDVPQCGYCQAGQIMAAAAPLAKPPRPTDAEIVTAMNGNLCRCATYLRIHAGVLRAAELAAAAPARPRRVAGGESGSRGRP